MANNSRHHVPYQTIRLLLLSSRWLILLDFVWFIHCTFMMCTHFFFPLDSSCVYFDFLLPFCLSKHTCTGTNPPISPLCHLQSRINMTHSVIFYAELDYSNNFRSCSQIKCILWFIFRSIWQQLDLFTDAAVSKASFLYSEKMLNLISNCLHVITHLRRESGKLNKSFQMNVVWTVACYLIQLSKLFKLKMKRKTFGIFLQ